MNTNMETKFTEQEQLEALKAEVRASLRKCLGEELPNSTESLADLMATYLEKTWDTAQYLEAQRHKSHHNPV